ncbi:DUF1643 domain-containing protein [Jeotgalibacillus aurantiacus]|uniref:DUF1643 domain-containing protein n=1 Tax=Jeotgalibacillus aurantiacus TaxID=2763266 RepID=UPI001D0B004D|nr:DUF1643 domain-containing protein [Jeotgalibacillus aurantiacus]
MPNRLWRSDEVVEAIFDTNDEQSRKYRYLLKCRWNEQAGSVMFVMLNPSVADQKICDPTLDRCATFARNWGYGGFSVVNLFALISTDPSNLKLHEDPVGPENDRYIMREIQHSDLTILAWGEKHGSILNRNREILRLFKDSDPHCIKKTKNGKHPRHPLFLKADLMPIMF